VPKRLNSWSAFSNSPDLRNLGPHCRLGLLFAEQAKCLDDYRNLSGRSYPFLCGDQSWCLGLGHLPSRISNDPARPASMLCGCPSIPLEHPLERSTLCRCAFWRLDIG